MAADYTHKCLLSYGTDCRYCPIKSINGTVGYFYCFLSENCCVDRCCNKGFPLYLQLLIVIASTLVALVLYIRCFKCKQVQQGIPLHLPKGQQKDYTDITEGKQKPNCFGIIIPRTVNEDPTPPVCG